MVSPLIQRGSIVLVRYPFSDLSATKVRPAVVITPNFLLPQIKDVLCLFVSSSIPQQLLATDVVLETSHPSFSTTGLRERSIFRTHKLALIEKSLVLRKLGEADSSLTAELNSKLSIAIGL